MIIKFKVCSSCKRKKDKKDFSNRPDKRWVNAYCKSCMNLRMKKWIKDNKKRFLLYQSKYRKEHEKMSNM